MPKKKLYGVRPAVKIVGRAPILVDADNPKESIARAERAIINQEEGVCEKVFNHIQEEQLNAGPSPRLIHSAEPSVFECGMKGKALDRHLILEAEDDELDRAKKRKSGNYTVIAYDQEKDARIRMVVYGETPEEAVRDFFRTFCEENYAPMVTFDFDQPIENLEQSMDVTVVSCHKGNSNECIHEALSKS